MRRAVVLYMPHVDSYAICSILTQQEMGQSKVDYTPNLSRVLVIDDFFGRKVFHGTNQDRVALCEKFGLLDVSAEGAVQTPLLDHPCAEAVFYRGQQPDPARRGDSVQNDLASSVRLALDGWQDPQGRWRPWAMVVLDLMFYTGLVTPESDHHMQGMPEGRPSDDKPEAYFGLDILRGIRKVDAELPVTILSSKKRDDVSRTFSELGASGFLERDALDSADMFRTHLARHGLIPDPMVLGSSRALLIQLRRARLLAEGDGTILIRGEPGTGKELMARFIHDASPRVKGPFEARSLASIPRDLAESELFGHSKGAFTGAFTARSGAFEMATNGTLFLDEIGDASLELQGKLLRVLESKTVQRIGTDERRAVNARVVSATNIDIEGRAKRAEGFRADLLARLHQAGTIVMPPLRDRREDIAELAIQFIRSAEQSHRKALPRQILPETLELLERHSWPGNVRELRNCITQAVYQHPDVEFLAPVHVLGFLSSGSTIVRVPTEFEDPYESGNLDLPRVIAVMTGYESSDKRVSEIVGALPAVQLAWSRLASNLVLTAIRCTKRVTVEQPEGEVLINPAMKLLSGNPRLTATQSADLIKKLLGNSPSGWSISCLGDKDLFMALEIAQRLRPKGGKKSSTE